MLMVTEFCMGGVLVSDFAFGFALFAFCPCLPSAPDFALPLLSAALATFTFSMFFDLQTPLGNTICVVNNSKLDSDFCPVSLGHCMHCELRRNLSG